MIELHEIQFLVNKISKAPASFIEKVKKIMIKVINFTFYCSFEKLRSFSSNGS